MIHKLADVQTSNIGPDTRIWQYSIVLKDAVIGSNCNICAFCFIENDVVVGNNVTIKNNISIWDGVIIEDDVHLGPSVVFTNDLRHRSNKEFQIRKIIIKKGASIGANSTILAGTTIGKYAMTGIGSVLTKDVPDFGLVYGNPARLRGFVDERGNKLKKKRGKLWQFTDGRILNANTGEITK